MRKLRGPHLLWGSSFLNDSHIISTTLMTIDSSASIAANSIFSSGRGGVFMIVAEALSVGSTIFLVLAIGMALAFEFVNGFHDTANAVATVIYTHTLKPWVAVTWSGC